jgi:transposase
LRRRGTLNPRAERVSDELFRHTPFLDPRDLVQVKYEMVRRVRMDGTSVVSAAEAFGFSRPSFYETQAAFRREGLAGLLPHKRGPRGGHKVTQQVLRFIEERRAEDRSLAATKLVPLIRARFGIQVHPRSIERALVRQERTRR